MKKLKRNELTNVIGGFQPVATPYGEDDPDQEYDAEGSPVQDPGEPGNPTGNPVTPSNGPIGNPGFRWPPGI